MSNLICGCGLVCVDCVYERALWSTVPVCHHFFWLFCHCVCEGVHFYNAITALGMLWFPYDFYAVPYAAQLSKSATTQRNCNIFYGAAFQMSLKTHIRQKKKKVGFGKSCHFWWSWSWSLSGYLSVSRKQLCWMWLLTLKPSACILDGDMKTGL